MMITILDGVGYDPSGRPVCIEAVPLAAVAAGGTTVPLTLSSRWVCPHPLPCPHHGARL